VSLVDAYRSGNYTLAARALVVDDDLETVVSEVPGRLLEGSVSIDRLRQIRREGSLTLTNEDAALDALIAPGRIWRLERGAIVAGVPQYVPMMTGLVDEVGGKRQVRIRLWGRQMIADQQFSSAVTLPERMRVRDAILQLGGLGGLGTAPELYDLDDGFATLQATRTFDEGENILAAMHTIAAAHALELYDDPYGRTTLRPFVDPSAQAPDWTFEPGEASILLSTDRTLKARRQIFNRTIVVGIGPDRYPIEAQARDLNPNSPTYNPPDGSGPMGDRPRPRFVSTDIHTQAAANAVALRLLYEGALADEDYSAAAMPLPFITERSVVRFPEYDDAFLLDKLTIPLRAGNMTMQSRRVRSLIA